ncbi:MAG: ribonuclease H-like YkuK family protein [Aquificaceae bacterium]|nr:ribonuclease H-like YkuK family protein [Aquificaceae bacterium]
MPHLKDLEEVKEFISKTSESTSIYVGCDSRQVKSNTVFVSVIVVHIDSCKGAKIFWKVERTNRIRSLRQRLLEEVSRAVFLALEISQVVGNRRFEVHLDINPSPQHGSSVILREAIGFVLAQGLKPVVKPHSIAASTVADYITAKY